MFLSFIVGFCLPSIYLSVLVLVILVLQPKQQFNLLFFYIYIFYFSFISLNENDFLVVNSTNILCNIYAFYIT